MLYVENHPSGAGFWLQIDAGEEFKLTREISHEWGESEVMNGQLEKQQVYFDYGFSTREPTVYRYYNKINNEWVLQQEITAKGNPIMWWNPANEPSNHAAQDPRDALVAFYGVRLAQLTRQGVVRVENPNHKSVFPVHIAYGFDPAVLPSVALRYGNGAGYMADIGRYTMEEVLAVEVSVFAHTQEELDSLTRAMRGMMGELSVYMVAMDCHNIQYGGFQQGIMGETSKEGTLQSQIYTATMTISCTAYTAMGIDDRRTWRLLPSYYLQAATYIPLAPKAPVVAIITAQGYHDQDDQAIAELIAPRP